MLCFRTLEFYDHNLFLQTLYYLYGFFIILNYTIEDGRGGLLHGHFLYNSKRPSSSHCVDGRTY
ncbi:hypothetical protein Mgra_00002846 [Meloidogyne graminicola]|uniref:Uncharacterized protein n=1 Tax=Meloidogyne graminicola TaxID=189291 RepID=A0A8S9ZWB2_9BILA|nr:hypothetical protein Mgra_00002846 [Meloidogyne graminicola]